MDVGIGKAARKRWINTISQDLISLNLTPVDVGDRDDWRRRTRVVSLVWLTPHVRDSQPEENIETRPIQ